MLPSAQANAAHVGSADALAHMPGPTILPPHPFIPKPTIDHPIPIIVRTGVSLRTFALGLEEPRGHSDDALASVRHAQ